MQFVRNESVFVLIMQIQNVKTPLSTAEITAKCQVERDRLCDL